MKKQVSPKEALQIVIDTIHSVENRCMAVDGPVTPTSEEITDAELKRMYDAARAALTASPQAEPVANPLDTPLPCRIDLGGMSFGKGVKLRTLVNAARRWREDAYGPRPSAEEAAKNLQALQLAAAPKRTEE